MNDANGMERAAQLEKAVQRGLEALERGDVDAARDELMRVAAATVPEPLAGGITDGELDAAFESAESERESMLDANSVAQAAIAHADRTLADEDEDEDAGDGASADHDFGERFTTATMAELLERQGNASAASRIRAALTPGEHTTDATPRPEPSRPPREQVIHTLETWLDNLRGGPRA